MPDIFCQHQQKKDRDNHWHLFYSYAYLSFYRPLDYPSIFTIILFLHGSNFVNYSLQGIVSNKMVAAFSMKQKSKDRAPKRFSAKTGLLFSAAITIFFAFSLKNIALILAIVLAIFALLESAFNFCAGCHVYNFYTKFLKKKSSILTSCFFLIFIVTANTTMAQTGKTETGFTVENYYKIKRGFADEFMCLWKTNHYPLLKKTLRKEILFPLLQSNQSCTAAKIPAGILK